MPRAALVVVGLDFASPNVRVDISLLAVVVDSEAAVGIVVVASLGVVSIVFSVASFPFLDVLDVVAIVVATEN